MREHEDFEHVDANAAGREIQLRDGRAHKLVEGEVVVTTSHPDKFDVFSRDEWKDAYPEPEEDDEPTVIPVSESDEDDDKKKDDSTPPETSKPAPAKKAASSHGSRS